MIIRIPRCDVWVFKNGAAKVYSYRGKYWNKGGKQLLSRCLSSVVISAFCWG